MGDRCYLRMRIHPDDYVKAKQVLEDATATKWPATFEDVKLDTPTTGDFWANELTIERGVLIIEEYEANYAWHSYCEELAHQGVRFVAWNGAGGDYGPGYQWSDDEVLLEFPTNDEASPIAVLTPEGLIPAGNKEPIRLALRSLKKAEDVLEKCAE